MMTTTSEGVFVLTGWNNDCWCITNKVKSNKPLMSSVPEFSWLQTTIVSAKPEC
jgi:hypothetical protein